MVHEEGADPVIEGEVIFSRPLNTRYHVKALYKKFQVFWIDSDGAQELKNHL